jgi:agmatinase
MDERIAERVAEGRSGQPALIGFPVDNHSSFLRGAADAPPLIREALRSHASNLWTEGGRDLETDLSLLDVGDVQDESTDGARIEEAVGLLLARGLRPIALGGDHSITSHIVRAFESRFDDLEMLQLDAHPDLYDSLDGSRASHACPMARILERGRVRRLVQAGIRTMNGHQKEQAERFGVEVIEMREWDGAGLPAFSGSLYITIDMDSLDPAFAPGVAHREPGGFSSRQMIDVIQRVEGRIVGADVVEFNPRRDPAEITAPLCAKLVKELAARMGS